MAIHAHSTTAPTPQRGLLRPTTDLATIEAEFADLIAQPWPALAAGESTTPQPSRRKGLAPKEALASTAAEVLSLDEADTAAQARAFHMRRELRKGLDYGLALMDAFDLTPRGLDFMDRTIAQLDAIEAPDEDLEPNQDGGDEDEACDYEETSLETFGRGLVRCGADDAEDDDPAERDDEHGSEDEAHPWRCDPSLVAFAVQVANV